MTQINSKADLSRAVANALHPEPPLSEVGTHNSGIWRWAVDISLGSNPPYGHWEPADFSGDPVASKLLRDRVRADGWSIHCMDMGDIRRCILDRHDGRKFVQGAADTTRDETSLALAFLRALGVKFTLVDGWDGR